MNSKLLTILCLLGGTLSLMMPAFINGYPIVYSDSSTYLASGFDLEAPFDRPITYGLFLRLTSLNGISLWSVIGTQSILLSYLLLRLTKQILDNYNNYQFTGFLIILFLSLFTSVSWTASQLMPDIFTAVMVLAAIIILTSTTTKTERLSLYFIFFLSVAMHMSHIPFCIALFAGILVFREMNVLQLKKSLKLQPILILMSLSILSFTAMGSAFSKSRHVFLMGALIEHGIAKKYLDENCDEKHYKLCAYKDNLPEKAWQFVWDESSPLNKIGGWKETKLEFNEIIWNTIKTPRYLALHFKESAIATFEQILRFKIGDGNGAFPSGTLLHERVGKYFPHELTQYETTRQNQNNLTYIGLLNTIQMITVIVSVLLLSLLIILKEINLLEIIVLITWSILVNAWVCGTFANAIDRLGSKVIWLIPLITGFLLIKTINDMFLVSSSS